MLAHPFLFFFPHTSTFPASGLAVVTGAVPFSAPVLAFNFYGAQGSAIPLLVDFSSSVVADSRPRAFRKSICAQEKAPQVFIRVQYALGGIRTHETDRYIYTRLEDNLIHTPPGRPALYNGGTQ